MTRQFLAGVAAFALLGVGAGSGVAGPVYTFDDLPVGMATPFSDTQGGVTAHFSQLFGNAFVVVPVGPNSFVPPIMGNILTDAVQNDQGGHEGLVVTFSQVVHGVSLDVGAGVQIEPGGDGFGLQAFAGGLGGTFVGQSFVKGETVGSGESQAKLSFNSATAFDTIVVSPSPTLDLWVDNLAIPEPAGLTLAAICFGALAVRTWRRQAAA
jgi:hypothetical protein